MSGIVAAHGPFDPDLGRRMLARLAHRGPDGEGRRGFGHAWLGHRRLAIADAEGGGQPLGDRTGELSLVADGAVLNHRRLRDELGDEGFRTSSDHEVALELFARFGLEGLGRLRGTFAIALAGSDGTFAVVRDVLGVAPLYWARRAGTVLFASELKAFDDDWLPEVEPFPPGHSWTPDGGLQEWLPPPGGASLQLRGGGVDEEPPAWVFDAIRAALVRAVEQARDAEVPVGAFLSGGLDSSIVTAIAARATRERGQVFPTFAAGLEGSRDLVAARKVAEHVGSEHHERVYTAEEAIDLVPQVIRVLESFDPMLVHSTVPNHLVAGLAGEHVKVVLIGEGADELFAGYSHYAQHTSGEDLHAELLETIAGLHIGGLQRVDRVTSANGIQARMPFLDLDLVELALALPPAWKLKTRERPEKWLLRRAFEDMLPEEIVWRRKEQFGQGTGMDEVLRHHFGGLVRDEELERERDSIEPPIRTTEELAYYRILVEHLPGVDAGKAIGRFVEA